MNDPSPLRELIQARIEAKGAVPFSWFMEQALYHSDYGYYRKMKERIGRKGDFYTSVSVGSLFGAVLSSQLLEMWERLDRNKSFTMVEQGAEGGQLAFDILSAMEANRTLSGVCYAIIEPFPEKRKEQQKLLQPRFEANVAWLQNPAELEPINGVFISNELVDSFPVRVVEWRNGNWSELYVGNGSEGFEFVAGDVLEPKLANALQELPTPTSSPYRTEINLEARSWIRSIGSKLQNGFVLVIDYGFSREEYYKPERMDGTLTGYARHRRIDNPLTDPGETDLTAHVEFTAVVEAGATVGLKLSGYTDQHHFMVGAGEAELKRLEQEINEGGMTKRQSSFLSGYRTLMHPGTMGMAFKYLLLQKGVIDDRPLSGFRYGSNPYRTLGIKSGEITPPSSFTS